MDWSQPPIPGLIGLALLLGLATLLAWGLNSAWSRGRGQRLSRWRAYRAHGHGRSRHPRRRGHEP